MTIEKIISKRIYLTVFSLASFLFFFNFAFAVTISPARVEIAGDPGNVFSGEVILSSDKDITQTLYTSFENFEAQGETGTPSFIESNSGLSSWITAPEKVIINPGEKTTMKYKINVPLDADPGGHFAAIFWSETPPNDKNASVSINSKIGMLVLLKISGDITEEANVLNFGTENGKRFFTKLPINFFYRLQNGGGDRIKPIGEIDIKSIFGNRAKINANEGLGNVLPRSIRKFDITWSKTDIKLSSEKLGFFGNVAWEWKNFAFGPFKAVLNLNISDNINVNKGYTLFVLPWQLIILFLVGICFILFIFKKWLRGYKNRIISRIKKVEQSENTESL